MTAFAYLSNLLQDRYIASVMPTSRFAVEKICSRVDPQSARIVIEYGPGTGVLTRSLLHRLGPDARLIAIERNEALAELLRRNCKDPRLQIYQECAGNVLDIASRSGTGEVDCVVSGIPFSFLSAEARMGILRDTHSILRQGGKFLAYQTFYQPPGCLRAPLRELFSTVNTDFAVLCVPPLLLVEAVK